MFTVVIALNCYGTGQVSDMGNPSLSNSTVITITVLDENDNSPELQDIIVLTLQDDSVSVDNTTGTVIIPENHPTYTSVSSVYS